MTIDELKKMLDTQMNLLERVLTIVEDQEKRIFVLETSNTKYGEVIQHFDPWSPSGIVCKDGTMDGWGISEFDIDKEDLQ